MRSAIEATGKAVGGRGAESETLVAPLKIRPSWRRFIGPKRALAVVAFAGTTAVAWWLRSQGYLDPATIHALLQERPLQMTFAFVLLYAVAVATALPTLPLNLAAGFVWGWVIGGVLSAAGATLGAIAAFILARFLFGQPLARRFDNRMLRTVQSELATKGWRFVAFVRLNPAFPTGPLNYLFGLTPLPLSTYAWSTFAFLLVPSWGMALIGHELGTFVAEGEARAIVRVILIVSGVVGILVGIGYVATLIRGTPEAPKDID